MTGSLTTSVKKRRSKRSERIFVVCMLALPVAQWLVFWLYVNIGSISLAFTDARTGGFSWANFTRVWEELTAPYGEIHIAVKNTLKYFLTALCITNPLALIVAYFLYKRIALARVFRIVYYLPVVVSNVAMVAVFTQFIDPHGVLGFIMKTLGKPLPPEGLLARPSSATNVILFYTVWTGLSTNMLLFGGAMTRVPTEVLESARLDGCSAFREFFQLILPLITPTITTIVIVTCTSVFTASGPILLFTHGNAETTTIAYWIFSMVYGNGVIGGTASNYNIVSCAGLCFTLVGVPIILTVRYIMGKIPTVEY